MLRPSDGAWLGSFGGPTGNKISFALGLSAAGTGAGERIYVADSGKNKVRVFDPQPPTSEGTITRDQDQVAEYKLTSGPCTFQDVRDADADADGNIYIANYKAHNVVKLSPTGACLTSWATGTQANNTPYGITVANDPGSRGTSASTWRWATKTGSRSGARTVTTS